MSGVRTFVVDDDEGSSTSDACCGMVDEEEVGISRELRRKMVFRRTEIAGSEKECYNLRKFSQELSYPYLGVQHEAWSNRLPPASREFSRRVNCVSKDLTRYI